MTVRVVLADDHQIFRDALGRTLDENGIELVGGTGNGREAVEMAKELSPDIIVMDIHMPLLNGIEATRPSVLAPVVEGYLEWMESQGMPPLHKLTKREREVLQLIAEGMNTQEAAHELKLGVRTVESHRSSLMEKLGLSNVVDLVHLAFQLGIVRTDS
jgi:DNA-binding NarL/FixJ family response regulator